MSNELLKKFALVSAKISASRLGLDDAQKSLMSLMGEVCNLPPVAAEHLLKMINDQEREKENE